MNCEIVKFIPTISVVLIKFSHSIQFNLNKDKLNERFVDWIHLYIVHELGKFLLRVEKEKSIFRICALSVWNPPVKSFIDETVVVGVYRWKS